MADAKVSALSSITPVDTDVLYVVDDPGGTPISAKATISAVLALAPGAAGGTDVAVADGGTGASTASGAATNLGLGAGNSPQFTAINLGHASDTTLHRSSPGVVAVEGAILAKLSDIASGTITARADDINFSGGSDGDVLTVQADGSLALEVPPGAAGGDAWSDPVNADIVPDVDSTRDVGSAAAAFAEGHFDSVFIGGTELDGTTLADPGADRLVFWDDSAGQIAYLTASTGLVLSGTTITVDFTGYIQGLVDDATPQLGGNLDLNGSLVGAASAADLTKLSEITATSTELNHVDGVTSAIQTQLDAKLASSSVFGTKEVSILVFDDSQDVATGDGAGDIFWRVPSTFNGMDLVAVAAAVQTAGTTNTTDIQIHNVTQAADMLTTKITIDSAETDSATAAAAAVIDTANDDVATGNILRIDVDAVSTTAPKGLLVELQFRLP